MAAKYTLPIITSSQTKVLEIIAENLADFEMFEIWLDYLDDSGPDFVGELVERYPNRIIVLFRRQLLEPIHMPLPRRLEILKALDGAAAMVDLDVTSQTAEFDFIRAQNLRVPTIGSYHNYHETPSTAELARIAGAIAGHHPDVHKIATFCSSDRDALRLLELELSFRDQGLRYVVLGMGPSGLITRLFGTLWGNELIFAPNDLAQQSAPGQLTRTQLKSIFKALDTHK